MISGAPKALAGVCRGVWGPTPPWNQAQTSRLKAEAVVEEHRLALKITGAGAAAGAAGAAALSLPWALELYRRQGNGWAGD